MIAKRMSVYLSTDEEKRTVVSMLYGGRYLSLWSVDSLGRPDWVFYHESTLEISHQKALEKMGYTDNQLVFVGWALGMSAAYEIVAYVMATSLPIRIVWNIVAAEMLPDVPWCGEKSFPEMVLSYINREEVVEED